MYNIKNELNKGHKLSESTELFPSTQFGESFTNELLIKNILADCEKYELFYGDSLANLLIIISMLSNKNVIN